MPGLLQPSRQLGLDDNGTIRAVKVKSLTSGQWGEMAMTIQLSDWNAWQAGEYIQNAMPYLTADQREFLLTGMTPEEWDRTFGDGDVNGQFGVGS